MQRTPAENPHTDPTLLAAAQAGDAEAFCALVAGEEARLVRQATLLCRDATLAEDLAQETLVAAWKSLRRFDGSCRLSTWLHAILLHRHHKALRRARIRPFFCLDPHARDEALRRLHALDGSPAAEAERAEQSERVRACVAALPEKHRRVIILRFFGEASLAEIGAALGCSVGTVKSRLFHALEKLRKMKMNLSGAARDERIEPSP